MNEFVKNLDGKTIRKAWVSFDNMVLTLEFTDGTETEVTWTEHNGLDID